MPTFFYHMGRIWCSLDAPDLCQREHHISRRGQVTRDRQAGIGYEDTEPRTDNLLAAMRADEVVGAEGEVMGAEIAAPHAEVFDASADAKTGFKRRR